MSQDRTAIDTITGYYYQFKAIPHKIKRTKEAECDKMGI